MGECNEGIFTCTCTCNIKDYNIYKYGGSLSRVILNGKIVFKFQNFITMSISFYSYYLKNVIFVF